LVVVYLGPLLGQPPPMLGAACASARLHLSEEFAERQAHLQTLIDYTNRRLAELKLPQFQKTDSPLFFIPVGLPKVTQSILVAMKKDGFYLNAASFPAVPMKKGGLRFMVNSRLSIEEIEAMLQSMQRRYMEILVGYGITCAQVAATFRIPPFREEMEAPVTLPTTSTLQVTRHRSIRQLDREEWNGILGKEGNLGYDNLVLLEDAFSGQELPENNWDFHYLHIQDEQQRTVLKTFLTVALTKDDMFSPAHISEEVEKERAVQPYYLTSRTVTTGSPITKGNHVYLDRNHPQWKVAMELLLKEMQQIQQECDATQIMVRDFMDEQDEAFSRYMRELGLLPYRLLDNFVVQDLTWNSTDEYLGGLNSKYRYNVRKEILKHEHKFITTHNDRPSSETELEELYQLYCQVFEGAYALNVFKLPLEYFRAMAQDPNYDLIKLYLKPEYAEDEEGVNAAPILVGVMFSYVNEKNYNALLVGLDYQYVRSHGTYKQILYQTLVRARALNCDSLDLAYTAELEKKKLGAKPQEVHAYLQVTEHDQLAVLDTL